MTVSLGSYGQIGILEGYIQIGLENNPGLKQKELSLQQSEFAVKESGSLFYPDLDFNARYSLAQGGRVIDIPIGDLLNPVYSTLNIITQTERFPMVENEEIPFLRPTEHETKLSLRQPIFKPAIYFNHKIKKDRMEMSGAAFEGSKSELIFEIRKGYFEYLKSVHLLDLMDRTILLLEENMRVTKSLYENDKVTIDEVYKSEAELSSIKMKKAEALKNSQLAASWFNHLLDRKYNQEIKISDDTAFRFPALSLDQALEKAEANRAEFRQIDQSISIAEKNLDLQKMERLPELFGAVDYGFQGEEYILTDEYDYVLASVVLRWDLFQGFKRNSRVQQAEIQKEIFRQKKTEIRNGIRMEVINAWHDLESSREALVAARTQVKSAKMAFRAIERKYKEGMVNMLAFTDARTTLTRAEQELIIIRYDLKIKEAALEKSMGITYLNL